jgi:SSS family solute:Na+ symporter
VIGTLVAAIHHGLVLPAGSEVGIKGGYLGAVLHVYPSEMAQNFWTAIFAWTSCFVATILISLATRREKSDDDLRGLVWALTPRVTDHNVPLWKRPATLGIVVLGCTLILNLIFW